MSAKRGKIIVRKLQSWPLHLIWIPPPLHLAYACVNLLQMRRKSKRELKKEYILPLSADEKATNQCYGSDPNLDPDPSDPYVFGPAGSGSGSISQRYGSGSGSFYHQANIVRKTVIPSAL